MNHLRIVAGCFVICLAGLGCQRPIPPTEPTRARVSAEDETAYSALWEACLKTCRSNAFKPDRRDLRAGVITTRPETSAYPIEFWREHLATPYDRGETLFHNIRRAVVLHIIPDEDAPGEYTVQVTVNKERMHATERQVNNAAGGLRVFSPSTPTVRGRRFNPQRDAYWSPVGRDGAFEQQFLDEILETYAASAPVTMVPPEPAAAGPPGKDTDD